MGQTCGISSNDENVHTVMIHSLSPVPDYTTAAHSQNVVSADFTCKQLLPFGFAAHITCLIRVISLAKTLLTRTFALFALNRANNE